MNRDVVEIILSKLPIDLRLPLRVPPNKVIPAPEVVDTLCRMARVASHPNQLRWTWARIEGVQGIVRIISYMVMQSECTYVEGESSDPKPSYNYMSACRTKYPAVGNDEFNPLVYVHGCNDVPPLVADELSAYERIGPIS
jgi:hypothetical protein